MPRRGASCGPEMSI